MTTKIELDDIMLYVSLSSVKVKVDKGPFDSE